MPASGTARSLAQRVSANNKNEIIRAEDLRGFQGELLGWFARAKRDLDWRQTRDPYRIWISEIMLQQTRVAAVLPYYRRFFERFPTIDRLARAPLDVVLRSWAGLGYYSRARNLHRAAQQIVAQHSGEFPRGMEAAMGLPGIGEYTAAAVLSIAYGEPRAVLDGNVARVLARLGAIGGDLRRPQRWRRLLRGARALLRADAAGEWNQAMMELGATVCTPRAPRCAACPVSRWCRARALGMAARLPTPRQKRRPIRLTLSAAIFVDYRGRTLLVRGKTDSSGLFSNLWHFPAVQSARPAPERLTRYLQSELGVKAGFEALPTARHTVTFRRILLAPYLVRVAKLPKPKEMKLARTIRLADIEKVPISNATRKIAASALKILSI